MDRHRVRNLLACPRCKAELLDESGRLVCADCGRHYDVSDRGIPVLIPESSQIPQQEAAALYGPGSRVNQLVRRWVASPPLVDRPTLHDRLRDTYVYGAPPDTLILNFGSGTDLRVEDERFVNLDIFPHENADVVGDGHSLPFKPATFDVVWLSAVLEHIRKPWVVADEVLRVLKPGGVVLVSVPFIQKHHGAPHDYFRYTPDGLRSVFDGFDEVDCGPSFTTPSGTLVHVLSAWMAAIFPGRLGLGLELLTARVLWWLKFLDRFVSEEQLANGILSGGSCFLGRKPVTPGDQTGRPAPAVQ